MHALNDNKQTPTSNVGEFQSLMKTSEKKSVSRACTSSIDGQNQHLEMGVDLELTVLRSSDCSTGL